VPVSTCPGIPPWGAVSSATTAGSRPGWTLEAHHCDNEVAWGAAAVFALRTVEPGVRAGGPGVAALGIDGRHLFTQVAGGFTGRVAGTAFDWFECVPGP
jgi:hypothetical protein